MIQADTQLFVCRPKNWSCKATPRQRFAYHWPSGHNNYICERPVFGCLGCFFLAL